MGNEHPDGQGRGGKERGRRGPLSCLCLSQRCSQQPRSAQRDLGKATAEGRRLSGGLTWGVSSLTGPDGR